MSETPKPIDILFHEALQHADAIARSQFLERACGHDLAMRAQLDRLLRSAAEMGEFMSRPPAAGRSHSAALDPDPQNEWQGTSIGPYTLLELLGEGGMGVVYLAEQHHPVRRRVALKLIRAGIDSGQIAARFEQERQTLALMDHPNIARVFDAGLSSDGRAYFAMEWVEGIPIADYCDKQHLTIEARIALFIPVCLAVQHAHQKSIIHRDLKPSNVIVAIYDGKPLPKVIDFGVAKIVGQAPLDRPSFTEIGQMIGTLEYMAPEQAEQNNFDIDTRADIYSLGVLLYELLTGSPPFTAKELRQAGWSEMMRILKEVEPLKPSTKITSSDDLPRVAANRRLEPQRLARSVSGELDWITLKCLEKDRSRRYETANGLAQDLQRFLANEPVQACPPTRTYRLKKFLRRHRVGVIASALIVLSLVTGIVGTAAGWIDARRQARLARAAEQRELLRANAEKRERLRAESAEAEAKAIIDFQRNDLIGQAGSLPQASQLYEPNPNLTVREALDRAAAAAGKKFAEQPQLEAAILKTIGEAFLHLGMHAAAIEQLLRADEIHRKLPQGQQTQAIAVKDSLAHAYLAATRYDEAATLFEQVCAQYSQTLGADHPATLTARDSLACAYREVGQTEKAIAMLEEVRDAKQRTLGLADPSTLVTLHNLASLCLDTGKTSEAIASLELVHQAKIDELGARHPHTNPSLQNLAVAYWKNKQLDRSIPLFEELLLTCQQIHGDDHPLTIGAMANLGVNLRDENRFEEAVALLEQARRLAGKHSGLQWIAPELTIAYLRMERFDAAAALELELLATKRMTFAPESSQWATILANSGALLLRWKAWADAEPVLRECLAIRERIETDEWHTFNTRCLLGEALLGQAKYPEAESMLLRGHIGIWERRMKTPPNYHHRLAETAGKLAQLYQAWGKPEQAAKWRRE